MESRNLFEVAVKENLVKNITIIVLAFLFYSYISVGLEALDAAKIGDFLLIVSMLLVTVCFANFAFSYEFLGLEKFGFRLLSHFATFLFMLLIAFLLVAIIIGVAIVYPSLLTVILVFCVLLYLGVALYDFWDFFRAFNKVYLSNQLPLF